jgi:CheY-like chemotaxis protein
MKKKKVLIIDDEVGFTNIVKLALEGRDGYEVCVENDPLVAVEAARKFWPDIIILDVVMPKLDGGELHMRLTADPILKHIPVIFLTAIVRQKEVEEHQGIIGGSVYIAKPVSVDRLISVIEKHIRS